MYTKANFLNIEVNNNSNSNDVNNDITSANNINNLSRSTPSTPSFLSMFSQRFEDKLKQIYFREDFFESLSANSLFNKSVYKQQLLLVRQQSLVKYKNSDLSSSDLSVARTKKAAKDFFILANDLLTITKQKFPLSDKNKCLGMAVIKGNKSVFIAISQDENAEKDIPLRKDMIDFLSAMNNMTDKWRFELVNTPLPMEYVLPRSLRMQTPRPASSQEINPRMRCVEIHLMVALNKVRRTIKFSPQDMAMIAFSATLWSSPNESKAVSNFGNISRNTKYLSENPLEITLKSGEKAYIDIWAPCKEHCSIYYKEMLAIALADKHFYGSRADLPLKG